MFQEKMSALRIKKFVFNSFMVNTYVIDYHGHAYIIDASSSTQKEESVLVNYIESHRLEVLGLINTHCHVDHILGVSRMQDRYKVDFMCHEKDAFLLESALAQAEFFGLDLDRVPKPDQFFRADQILNLDGLSIRLLHIPGHSPGSVAFYVEKEEVLFSGDVLFAGSIGRTDLPGGDYSTLINGIREKILSLDESVKIFPGHGPSTDIHKELLTNPFLQESY